MLITMSGLSYALTDPTHSTNSCDCVVHLFRFVVNVEIPLWLIAQLMHPHAVFYIYPQYIIPFFYFLKNHINAQYKVLIEHRAAQVSDHSCSLLFQIRSASPNLQMTRQYEVAATYSVHQSQGEHNSIPALPSFSDTKITGFSVAAAACTATNHQSCQRQVAMPPKSPMTLIAHHLPKFLA